MFLALKVSHKPQTQPLNFNAKELLNKVLNNDEQKKFALHHSILQPQIRVGKQKIGGRETANLSHFHFKNRLCQLFNSTAKPFSVC
jgi:hypothetical protein